MIGVDQWSPADGLSLEPNALQAAKEIKRNLVLRAGPGAGKTEMLAQRADFLLRTSVCLYPKRILAISFKVDASQNLASRVRKRCGDELAARFDSQTFHAFAKRIIDRFRPVLKGQEALDPDYSVGPHRIQRRSITFDDMVPLAVRIVESSRIARDAIRQTYSYVFLDEFQDCTNEQYTLIRACFEGTRTMVTAVGDPKQRIMGWAGALEGIFKSYAADFHAHPLSLYQNFRSAPRLRRMQNAMVRVMDAPAALKDDELPGEAGEIKVLRFNTDDEEANALADAVRGWIDEDDVDPSKIAILVSKQQNLYCQKLRGAFATREVPFRNEDELQNLASEPVANLIVDFLRVVAGHGQPALHRRLLDVVVFRRGLDLEREYRARLSWDRLVTMVSKRIASGELDLANFDDLRAVCSEVLNFVGHNAVVELSSAYVQERYLQQQIEKTIGFVHAIGSNDEDLTAALDAFSGERAVRIMSIHKSKGLEFDTVVLLGVENQTFWGDAEAERSAFFVGISRAKRSLVLTVCEERERPSGAKRWDVARSEHEEFVGYATAYL